MKTIQLTRGKEAIVDDADYEWLSQVKWTATRSPCGYYAARWRGRRGHQQKIYMHRAIMCNDLDGNGELGGRQVHHKDRPGDDGLDNRRANLELCDQKQNLKYRKKPKRKGS